MRDYNHKHGGTFKHTEEHSHKIKVHKTTRSFTWEIEIKGSDPDAIIEEIEKINAKLSVKFAKVQEDGVNILN